MGTFIHCCGRIWYLSNDDFWRMRFVLLFIDWLHIVTTGVIGLVCKNPLMRFVVNVGILNLGLDMIIVWWSTLGRINDRIDRVRSGLDSLSAIRFILFWILPGAVVVNFLLSTRDPLLIETSWWGENPGDYSSFFLSHRPGSQNIFSYQQASRFNQFSWFSAADEDHDRSPAYVELHYEPGWRTFKQHAPNDVREFLAGDEGRPMLRGDGWGLTVIMILIFLQGIIYLLVVLFILIFLNEHDFSSSYGKHKVFATKMRRVRIVLGHEVSARNRKIIQHTESRLSWWIQRLLMFALKLSQRTIDVAMTAYATFIVGDTTFTDLTAGVAMLFSDEFGGKLPSPWLTRGIPLDQNRDYAEIDFILSYIGYTWMAYGYDLQSMDVNQTVWKDWTSARVRDLFGTDGQEESKDDEEGKRAVAAAGYRALLVLREQKLMTQRRFSVGRAEEELKQQDTLYYQTYGFLRPQLQMWYQKARDATLVKLQAQADKNAELLELYNEQQKTLAMSPETARPGLPDMGETDILSPPAGLAAIAKGPGSADGSQVQQTIRGSTSKDPGSTNGITRQTSNQAPRSADAESDTVRQSAAQAGGAISSTEIGSTISGGQGEFGGGLNAAPSANYLAVGTSVGGQDSSSSGTLVQGTSPVSDYSASQIAAIIRKPDVKYEANYHHTKPNGDPIDPQEQRNPIHRARFRAAVHVVRCFKQELLNHQRKKSKEQYNPNVAIPRYVDLDESDEKVGVQFAKSGKVGLAWPLVVKGVTSRKLQEAGIIPGMALVRIDDELIEHIGTYLSFDPYNEVVVSRGQGDEFARRNLLLTDVSEQGYGKRVQVPVVLDHDVTELYDMKHNSIRKDALEKMLKKRPLSLGFALPCDAARVVWRRLFPKSTWNPLIKTDFGPRLHKESGQWITSEGASGPAQIQTPLNSPFVSTPLQGGALPRIVEDLSSALDPSNPSVWGGAASTGGPSAQSSNADGFAAHQSCPMNPVSESAEDEGYPESGEVSEREPSTVYDGNPFHMTADEQTVVAEMFRRSTKLIACWPITQAGQSVAFIVVRDEFLKSIVVCFRGTADLQDVFTDVAGDMSDFETLTSGLPPEIYGVSEDYERVYGNFKNCAVHFLNYCDENGIFLQVPDGWNFVITGHSLGAGVTCIVGLLMKRRFPDWAENGRLRCLLAAPPGLSCSAALARETRTFQITVVNQTDAVPVSRYESAAAARNCWLDALENSLFSKLEIEEISHFTSLAYGEYKATARNEKETEEAYSERIAKETEKHEKESAQALRDLKAIKDKLRKKFWAFYYMTNTNRWHPQTPYNVLRNRLLVKKANHSNSSHYGGSHGLDHQVTTHASELHVFHSDLSGQPASPGQHTGRPNVMPSNHKGILNRAPSDCGNKSFMLPKNIRTSAANCVPNQEGENAENEVENYLTNEEATRAFEARESAAEDHPSRSHDIYASAVHASDGTPSQSAPLSRNMSRFRPRRSGRASRFSGNTTASHMSSEGLQAQNTRLNMAKGDGNLKKLVEKEIGNSAGLSFEDLMMKERLVGNSSMGAESTRQKLESQLKLRLVVNVPKYGIRMQSRGFGELQYADLIPKSRLRVSKIPKQPDFPYYVLKKGHTGEVVCVDKHGEGCWVLWNGFEEVCFVDYVDVMCFLKIMGPRPGVKVKVAPKFRALRPEEPGFGYSWEDRVKELTETNITYSLTPGKILHIRCHRDKEEQAEVERLACNDLSDVVPGLDITVDHILQGKQFDDDNRAHYMEVEAKARAKHEEKRKRAAQQAGGGGDGAVAVNVECNSLSPMQNAARGEGISGHDDGNDKDDGLVDMLAEVSGDDEMKEENEKPSIVDQALKYLSHTTKLVDDKLEQEPDAFAAEARSRKKRREKNMYYAVWCDPAEFAFVKFNWSNVSDHTGTSHIMCLRPIFKRFFARRADDNDVDLADQMLGLEELELTRAHTVIPDPNTGRSGMGVPLLQNDNLAKGSTVDKKEVADARLLATIEDIQQSSDRRINNMPRNLSYDPVLACLDRAHSCIDRRNISNHLHFNANGFSGHPMPSMNAGSSFNAAGLYQSGIPDANASINYGSERVVVSKYRMGGLKAASTKDLSSVGPASLGPHSDGPSSSIAPQSVGPGGRSSIVPGILAGERHSLAPLSGGLPGIGGPRLSGARKSGGQPLIGSGGLSPGPTLGSGDYLPSQTHIEMAEMNRERDK